MTQQKIFEIGFNKCATRAVYVLLRASGIPSRHWDRGKIANSIREGIRTGDVPLQEYEGIRFFSDMVVADSAGVFEAYKEFKYLDETFPNSLFVYNLRDVDKWIVSRCNHGNGFELNVYAKTFNLKTNEEVIAFWRNDWEEHRKNVVDYFKSVNGLDRLLFINIEDPDFAEMSEFLNCDIDPNAWEVVGKTKAKT